MSIQDMNANVVHVPFQDCDCVSMQQLWQIFHQIIGGRSLVKDDKFVI